MNATRREPCQRTKRTLAAVFTLVPTADGNLGKKASPYRNPVMAPPPCPRPSVWLSYPKPENSITLNTIASVIMTIRISLVCSSWVLPSKAFQFTNISASDPVRIPQIEVEAPTDLAFVKTALMRFPPTPETK